MINREQAIKNHRERVAILAELKNQIEELIDTYNTLNHGYYNSSCRDLGFPNEGEEIHGNKLVERRPVTTYKLTYEVEDAITVAKKKDGTWSKKSDGRGITWDAPDWYRSGDLAPSFYTEEDGTIKKEEYIVGKNEWLDKERLKCQE